MSFHLQTARGETDFGIGHLIVDANSFQVLDVLTAVYPLHVNLIARNIQPLPASLNIFKPFSQVSWTLILLAFIVSTLVALILWTKDSYK